MDIVQRLETALKSITTPDLGESKLVPEQAQRFMRAVTEATPMLDESRFLEMNSHTKHIDRVGFGERILQPAEENVEPEKSSKPGFKTNKLKSEELIAVVGITDSTLEDNLERESFENTLVDMMGERAGLDLEELFINGNTSSTGQDAFIKTIDGWIEKAGNQAKKTTDFDATDVESFFDALIGKTPKKFLRDRKQWRIYTTWDIEDTYRNVLRSRGTALGDSAQTGADVLYYKGFPVVSVPNMPAGTGLLSLPDNQVYGLYRDVRIEPDRLPKARRTDFVLTMRTDCHYENEKAATVAKGFTGPTE